jgi:hypothetical protein
LPKKKLWARMDYCNQPNVALYVTPPSVSGGGLVLAIVPQFIRTAHTVIAQK